MNQEINYKQLLEKYAPDKNLKVETGELDITEDSLELAKELLAKLQPILETRNRIKKESDDLTDMLQQVVIRLDEVIMLKNVNAQQESEVLKLLKQELLS